MILVYYIHVSVKKMKELKGVVYLIMSNFFSKYKKPILIVSAVLLLILIGVAIYFIKYYNVVDNSFVNYVEPIDNTVSVNETSDGLVYNVDWDGLREINPDIVGWIVIPDTKVNYPIVQSEDNQYYLHRAFNKEKSIYGSIFMSAFNYNDFSDWNTILYGHNMKDGSMFKTVNYYKDEEYCKEHLDVWILTPKSQKKYQVISAHIAQDGDSNYDYVFEDDSYKDFIDSQIEQSLYDTGVTSVYDKRCITLSTCTSRTELERFIIVCQLAKEIKTSEATGYIKNITTDDVEP